MSVVAMLILSRPMYLNNYYITNQTRNNLCQEGYSSSPCVTNVIAKWNLTWAVTVWMTFKFQISLFGNSTENNNEINAANSAISCNSTCSKIGQSSVEGKRWSKFLYREMIASTSIAVKKFLPVEALMPKYIMQFKSLKVYPSANKWHNKIG